MTPREHASVERLLGLLRVTLDSTTELYVQFSMPGERESPLAKALGRLAVLLCKASQFIEGHQARVQGDRS